MEESYLKLWARNFKWTNFYWPWGQLLTMPSKISLFLLNILGSSYLSFPFEKLRGKNKGWSQFS